MDDSRPETGRLEAAWIAFEKDILDSIGPIPDALRAQVRENFYAGQSAMFSVLQPLLAQAKTPEAVRQVLKHAREALDQAMDED
jgi:hypothetical protein